MMAAYISIRTATIILGVIAGVYGIITVALLVCICCICYKRRRVRAISPKNENVSPRSSDVEPDPGSNPGSPTRKSTSTTYAGSVTERSQLPSRYRSKGKKKPKIDETATWGGMRDSPVLRHHDAWIGEKSSPRTPDSGLALSLADSKHSAGWAISDSQSGSTKESYSAGSNEDVFDESVSQSKSKSFDEIKRDVLRHAPKPVRTEATMPLMEEDSEDPRTPGSEMEFDLKTILPSIREKTRSPDSLDGTLFVNKSAIAVAESANEKPTTYTELSTFKEPSIIETLAPTAAGRHRLPPIQHGHGGGGGVVNLVGGGQLFPSRVGHLPPLFPPGHSQENLNEIESESDEQSTTL